MCRRVACGIARVRLRTEKTAGLHAPLVGAMPPPSGRSSTPLQYSGIFPSSLLRIAAAH